MAAALVRHGRRGARDAGAGAGRGRGAAGEAGLARQFRRAPRVARAACGGRRVGARGERRRDPRGDAPVGCAAPARPRRGGVHQHGDRPRRARPHAADVPLCYAPLDTRGAPRRRWRASRRRRWCWSRRTLAVLDRGRNASSHSGVSRLGTHLGAQPAALPEGRTAVAQHLRTPARVGARSEADAERFAALGVAAERIAVTGDLKLEAPSASPELAPDLARLLAGAPFWVAASTRPARKRPCSAPTRRRSARGSRAQWCSRRGISIASPK